MRAKPATSIPVTAPERKASERPLARLSDAAWAVRGTGKWGMLVASVLLIEIGYAWLLTVAIARGYFKQLIEYKADSHHNTWVKVRGANLVREGS